MNFYQTHMSIGFAHTRPWVNEELTQRVVAEAISRAMREHPDLFAPSFDIRIDTKELP